MVEETHWVPWQRPSIYSAQVTCWWALPATLLMPYAATHQATAADTALQEAPSCLPKVTFEGKESARGLEGRLGPFYRLRLQISAPGSATRKEGSVSGMAWPSLRSFHVSCLSRPAFQRLLALIPKAGVATSADSTPAATIGWPCFHRFFPAGAGFLPSQECAPRMSILISPAL